MDGEVKRLAAVEFDGDKMQVTEGDLADAKVVLKPACDALGLDFSGQVQRLKRQAWACVGVMPMRDSTGRVQEMFWIALESLPMWLATIQASRVRAELRPKLERYQREAAKVLAAHFLGRNAAPKPPLSELPPFADVEHGLGLVERIESLFTRNGGVDVRTKFDLRDAASSLLARIRGRPRVAAGVPLTVQNIAMEMGIRLDQAGAVACGKRAVGAYRLRHGGAEPGKIPDFKGSREIEVFAYGPDDREMVEQLVRDYVAEKAAHPAPGTQLALPGPQSSAHEVTP